MNPYIKPIAEELLNLADTERAVSAKAYMKNQFDFFGIPMAERRALCKKYMKQSALKSQADLEVIVNELWMLPQREFQYFGIELMAFHEKLWQASIIHLLNVVSSIKAGGIRLILWQANAPENISFYFLNKSFR